MIVFGEDYDLSKCTPEEIKKVEDWYEKNRDEIVPLDTDTPQGTCRTEAVRSLMKLPSDPLDIAEALKSIQGNPEFCPKLQGKAEHLKLYALVHPLGGNMNVKDAAEQLGITKATAYRQLTRLAVLNPGLYDLHRWPTKAQLDCYRLIHPDLGGLTVQEAAKALGSTYQHVVQLISRMKKTHPDAFVYRTFKRPKIREFIPARDETNIKEVF